MKPGKAFTKTGIKIIFSLFIFLIVIGNFFPLITSQGNITAVKQDQIIKIMFDESHINPDGDYSVSNFASDRAMKEPVTLLREEGFKVNINNEEITLELLNDKIGEKGLLILCLLDDPISEEEGAAINEWVRNGGSVFTSTEPDYAGFSYSKNENTNDLLKYLEYNESLTVYDIMHLYSLAGEGDEIVDHNKAHRTILTGNVWDVEITQEQFANTSLGNALKKDIETVILGCSSIVVSNKSWVGGYAYNESVSQPDGGIDPYDPAFDDLPAIPWVAGGEIGNGGKVLLLGGMFTISGWSLYATSYKFIEQANNAVLWTNIVSWLVDVSITPPVIIEKIKLPLIDFLSMGVGIFAVVSAFTTKQGQRRFLRYLLIVGILGVFSSLIGTIQHIFFEWQYIGSGLDRYWSLPQDADPVQNAAVRYLFAGLAGPVLISILPALFLIYSRSRWGLGQEFTINMLNLRFSTPEDKYKGNLTIAPLRKRIFAFVIDIVPFLIGFILLYLFIEEAAVRFISRDLFSMFTEGAPDTSAITNIDFIALLINGSIALSLIPLELLAFLIQYTTFSFFVIAIIFFIYYFLSLRLLGGTIGQKLLGIEGAVNYEGKPLGTKRIFLKTVFLMFLDSSLFYLSSYFLLLKKDNKLLQTYSDRLIRAVVVNKIPTKDV